MATGREALAMGGGEKNQPDVLKGPPRDVLAELDGSGGGEDGEVDACARPRIVEFRAHGLVQAGTLVTVLAGKPPTVLDGGGQIGVLAGEGAAGVEECLHRGFEMAGIVESPVAAGGVGRLGLTGQLL
jgi:hypothetical protein